MNTKAPNTIFELKFISVLHEKLTICTAVLFFLCSWVSSAQVTTQIDTTTIKIGEQISYKINVETDSVAIVVFPEGQTFLPLEAVEATDIDTVRKESQYLLSRIYKLTQFDSGRYTIPRQKVLIGDRSFFTDSVKVAVNYIEVDTTKQKLYDIKPIMEVQKSSGNWWKWLLLILGFVGLVAFLIYWFIWRKKPLTEEEEIALLPPYDRAKLALHKLEEHNYLRRSEIKTYYSELTFIIRKYLDDKVYDRSLESTTDELISRLKLFKDGNQFPFKTETIVNIESILKRADLVKFAKSKPDTALAEIDKKTVEKEIDNIKTCLPEPSEEEKLLDEQYKENREKKQKRQKIILTAAISIALLVATYVGFSLKYGFTYVNDTILGDESKELLVGDWVESAYGFPPIWIETPEVLKREEVGDSKEEQNQPKTAVFRFLSKEAGIDIQVSTTTFNISTQQGQPQQMSDEDKAKDLISASENFLKKLEANGATDITVKREEFKTPNGASGIKTYGTMNLVITENKTIRAKYMNLVFRAENVRQQIVLRWRESDNYAEDIVKRITDSIELVPEELPKEDDV
ncbi:hypothetical protein [Winogradskyella aurantia]|uniref:DUF4381 domain-containing protein n=1 Tax=Winogradskyella aurantia TaxID=1915063 RepID=A0A265V0B7_9FLAO|nr:hypothetical protein [Winogradskyella aurantia]OZV70995.1 hypothetical protein CA834_02450 [Winogradskyella aurantia]